MKAEKRLTHGLNVIWNYTFSKTMECNMGSIVNERRPRTVSDADRKHMMHLAAVYELPGNISGRANLLNRTVGGWAVSAFWLAASGMPVNVTGTRGRPCRLRNAAPGGPVSARLGDPKDARGNPLNPYFDITAFAPLPTQYMVSPEPPRLGALCGSGKNRVNAAIFKTFRSRERLRLEARPEARDAFNHPQFDDPETDMTNRAKFGVVESAGGSRKCFGALRPTF